MEQFEERLARLTELSPDELVSLEQELVAAFEAADSASDVEGMQAYAAALINVRDEKAGRSAEQPEAAPEPAPAKEEPVPASATADEPKADDPDTPAEGDTEAEAVEETPAAEPEVETPEVETPEPVAVAEVEAAPEEVVPTEPAAEVPSTPAVEDITPTSEEAAVPVAAAVTNESEDSVDTQITAEDVPEENSPTPAAPPVVIRAGGDIPGVTAGTQLPDMDGVVDALTAKVNSMRGVRGDGEHIIVASMRVEDEVPDSRLLRSGDAAGNSRKIRELLSDQETLTHDGLVASAWCAPRAPVYDVPTIGTTRRPVANSLPTFTADRGGITWMQPPGIGVGGVGLWRHDGEDTWESFTDPAGTGAAGTTKPCATVVCGDEMSIDVDAITLCLCFDNMSARAFPEWIRANTDLVMVQQARFAEQVLLSRMFSAVATGTAGTVAESVGVARDFLVTARVAAAQFRWSRRLDPRAPLQLLAPSWLGEAIASDLDLQSPGDNTYGTSYTEVNSVLRELGIDPIWYIDDVPGTATFGVNNTYPATAQWLLYPTGTFLRLDSGSLNIGVVRDMEHVQANTYCEFSETFETVAYMGPGSPYEWVTRGVTEVNLFGSSGAPIDLTD